MRITIVRLTSSRSPSDRSLRLEAYNVHTSLEAYNAQMLQTSEFPTLYYITFLSRPDVSR